MKDIRFITRADDAGSSHAANLAIAGAVKAGFIKNVSLMAPGYHIEEAAQMLAGSNKVCFGLHSTLNAEWDRVKWKPLHPVRPDSGLVDENGYFLADPAMFARSLPSAETAMAELAAQLDRLTALGFAIRYIDSHMFAEAYIPGLDEAMAAFAKRKGLIDHMYFYRLPPDFARMNEDAVGFLRRLPAGQYFYVAHPAKYSEEMRLTGNAQYSGEEIASGRGKEARLLSNRLLAPVLRLAFGLRPLRYDEAEPLDRRLTAEDVRNLL